MTAIDEPLPKAISTDRQCSVPACTTELVSKGMCRLHWERQHRTGTTDDPAPRVRELNSGWKGDNVSYGGVHWRLAQQGRPEACTHCGDTRTRHEWALRPDAPEATIQVSPDGYRYTTDLAQYENLCKRCHNIQDLGRDVCGMGHDLTPENTYIQPKNGKRFCRTCQARRRRERHERAMAGKAIAA